MGSSLYHLRVLDLHDNGFSGHVPWTFHNCTSLVLINLEGNHLPGSIPTWMPQNVSVVKLRSNQFTGNIPPQLCNLSTLIVLDLANNDLSGSIPHCLPNILSLISEFQGNVLTIEIDDQYGFPISHEFKIDLHTKGQQLEYERNLKLVRIIDLSANKLSGEIPVQLFKLAKLQSLNLSYNYLIGEIQKQIGEMKDLESLDFSHNSLHGNIPQSMSGLSFLSDLNLSYNHFSGQIPLGTQLQSFDAWSCTGNPELCGAPLPNNCTALEKPDDTKEVEGNDEDAFLRSLYLGMGVGFAVGFWQHVADRSTYLRGSITAVAEALLIVCERSKWSRTLESEINLSSLLALEFLELLDLSYNDFERINTPSINSSVAATHGHLLANFSLLDHLDLSYNMHLRIDNFHWLYSRLPSLTLLDLSGIHLPSETNLVQSLALLSLEELYLYDYMETTSWLFNLSNDLTFLRLNQCNLRGPIPDFSGYQNLLFIPSNLVNASSLGALDISFNELSGKLPTNIDQRCFEVLDLSQNSINGGISNLLLEGLKVLMSFNRFKGRLPQASNRVQALSLAYNSFSRSLSSLLCHTAGTNGYALKYLDISNSYLTEELPDCWSNWTFFSYIYLGNNQLVGQVPPAMGSSLYQLRALDLHDNGFSGHIGEMKDLESLEFSHNSLHRNIPQSMSGLSFLSDLNLSYNRFSGQIPLRTQLQSFDPWSYTGNPDLYGAPLQKNYTLPEKLDNTKQVEGSEDDGFLRSLYLGMGVRFAVGF
ncbi:receptor-like protein EIX1 [Prosopis cineraria]|uniref:receptor-like protein EIX1 n=1 Tax=Prosopis cineraria TaxID=364024 RepID=UPI00241020A9|nr:receptor-like protein EIX1 [Prosopis cineraria]